MMLYQPGHDDNHHHVVQLHDYQETCTAPQRNRARRIVDPLDCVGCKLQYK
jgi:hypothetical protein